jgi:uncharacterized protein
MRNHMKLMLFSTTLLAVGLGGCSVTTDSISQESAMVQNIPDETLNIDKNANQKFEAEIKAYGKLPLKELMAKANQGDRVAQYEVGNRYYHGNKMDAQGLPRNYKKAGQWYQKSADQGYGPAWYALSGFYDTYNVNTPSLAGWEFSVEKSLECIEKAAATGYVYAQHVLALRYVYGTHGTPQDFGKAFKWFHVEAVHGDSIGEYWLGQMYERGLGVPQDYAKAIEWYEKAVDHKEHSNGKIMALEALSRIYEEGKGVPQDYKKVFEYEMLHKVRDYFKLGGMYAEGKGVPQDYEKAVECYLKGANQHDDRAMYALGSIYAEGRFAPQDLQKSKSWYQKAADQGLQEAKESLERLQK